MVRHPDDQTYIGRRIAGYTEKTDFYQAEEAEPEEKMILRLSDGADRAQTNAFKELKSDDLSMCREAFPSRMPLQAKGGAAVRHPNCSGCKLTVPGCPVGRKDFIEKT